MKISLVITEGYKQVMFQPETEHEKNALKMIAPDDVLVGVAKRGTFDNEDKYANETIHMCQGGYLRRFAQSESLMFVIQDKVQQPNPSNNDR